jgi:predicted transcriptional regulator
MIKLPQINLVEEIEAAIKLHGITRKALFAKAGVDQTNMEKWRNGAVPTLAVIQKIVTAINSLEGRKRKVRAQT